MEEEVMASGTVEEIFLPTNGGKKTCVFRLFLVLEEKKGEARKPYSITVIARDELGEDCSLFLNVKQRTQVIGTLSIKNDKVRILARRVYFSKSAIELCLP